LKGARTSPIADRANPHVIQLTRNSNDPSSFRLLLDHVSTHIRIVSISARSRWQSSLVGVYFPGVIVQCPITNVDSVGGQRG